MNGLYGPITRYSRPLLALTWVYLATPNRLRRLRYSSSIHYFANARSLNKIENALELFIGMTGLNGLNGFFINYWVIEENYLKSTPYGDSNFVRVVELCTGCVRRMINPKLRLGFTSYTYLGKYTGYTKEEWVKTLL